MFLKSVHPDDSLEKVILEQTPELVGLGITQGKLKSFIEHFGRHCLLILDGLDEHAMGSNDDVMKVIRHEKYINCNIFLTSRPHSTLNIKSHFDTIVSVEGFTRSEARKFAYCIVRDDKVVEQILDFNPTGGKKDVALCKCPILLSFICILVREKALDLSTATQPTGEIYARMVQCLYKKFTLRREIEFDVIEFTRVVGLVGKLAWATLSSHEPLFKRSIVEKAVGKDAFDYGFLIGNEDMIGDVKADILITFPHRSIQEFFGAFFFVLQLIEGKDIESILGASHTDPIFLKNPLFLHFIFWFLSESCGDEYFSLGNTRKACEILHFYIYDRIHRLLGTRRFTETFPALDFKKSLDTKDKINIEHFERMLKRFHQIKYLTAVNHDVDDAVDDWIFNHILPTCNALTVLTENESLHCVLPKLIKVNGSNVNILLSEKAYREGILTCLLQTAAQYNRKPAVYLFLTEGQRVHLSKILHQEMHQLHMVGISSVRMSQVIAAGKLVSATFLTHLSMIGRMAIHKTMLLAINKAVRKGNLPRLQSLCFRVADVISGSNDLFRGKAVLFNVTHLDFSICNVNKLRALYLALKNGLLPKLTSLAIRDHECSSSPPSENYFDCSRLNFTSLSVEDMTERSFRQLSKAISQSKLIHLMKLCLSAMQKENCDIRIIEPDKIPLLEHFCGLFKL